MRLHSKHTSKIEVDLEDTLGLIRELNRLKVVTKEVAVDNPYLLDLYRILQDIRSEPQEND